MRRSLGIISGAFALRNQVFARVNGVAARDRQWAASTHQPSRSPMEGVRSLRID
jgi:hypothetical protein